MSTTKHTPWAAPRRPTHISATVHYNAFLEHGVVTVILPIPEGYASIERLLTLELDAAGRCVLRLECRRFGRSGP